MSSLSSSSYEKFTTFLEKNSGICLGKNKEYLVTSRLRGLMKEESLSSIDDLVEKANKDIRGTFKKNVIDAMTTNETLWFRDGHPFDILKNKILPEYYENNKFGKLKIWSAACSTGQEPYSISIILDEFNKAKFKTANKGEKIVATDLSPSVVLDAKAGEYPMLAIGRGLEDHHLKSHFTETPEGKFKIKPDIASRVSFKNLNLQDSYAGLGKFDVVFCRNVLIYFTPEFKKDILTKIHALLNPGGYLLIGASEAVNDLSDKFEMVHCRPGIIYKKI